MAILEDEIRRLEGATEPVHDGALTIEIPRAELDADMAHDIDPSGQPMQPHEERSLGEASGSGATTQSSLPMAAAAAAAPLQPVTTNPPHHVGPADRPPDGMWL